MSDDIFLENSDSNDELREIEKRQDLPDGKAAGSEEELHKQFIHTGGERDGEHAEQAACPACEPVRDGRVHARDSSPTPGGRGREPGSERRECLNL